MIVEAAIGLFEGLLRLGLTGLAFRAALLREFPRAVGKPLETRVRRLGDGLQLGNRLLAPAFPAELLGLGQGGLELLGPLFGSADEPRAARPTVPVGGKTQAAALVAGVPQVRAAAGAEPPPRRIGPMALRAGDGTGRLASPDADRSIAVGRIAGGLRLQGRIVGGLPVGVEEDLDGRLQLAVHLIPNGGRRLVTMGLDRHPLHPGRRSDRGHVVFQLLQPEQLIGAQRAPHLLHAQPRPIGIESVAGLCTHNHRGSSGEGPGLRAEAGRETASASSHSSCCT